MEISDEDAALILDCIDTLGIASTTHEHVWSEGEKTIYETACEILGEMPRNTFFESDSDAGEEWKA